MAVLRNNKREINMNNVSQIHPVQVADPTVVFWHPGFVVLSF